MNKAWRRPLAIGANITGPEKVCFRVWAPGRKRVEVVLEPEAAIKSVRHSAPFVLDPEDNGYFSAEIQAERSMFYRYRLDGGELRPDPASRFQPLGPHGSSQIIDPSVFPWTDAAWPGARLDGQVIYEMHVGTFTPEGTWAAAAQQLSELAELGVTVIEIMPVADFPGSFGWGYDGVNLFAPTRLYGSPDDFRRFVDQAHRAGLAVILDVVYNHLGPEGNYLTDFSKDYFTERYENEWGQALNFDGPDSGPVRDYFIGNAEYWIREFHLDGFRVDAAHTIHDSSETHILSEIVAHARQAADNRSTLLIAEFQAPRPTARQTTLAYPIQQAGFDAVWNEDFHHSLKVAVTGHNEGYFSDHFGAPQELISAVKRGFLYQGQVAPWVKKRRGSPTAGLQSAQFIHFIENHDQVANTGLGLRLHQKTSPGRLRAATALLLLGPQTPMLFQGQEFGASSPFLFFCDMEGEIAELVRKGRLEFLSQFPSLALPEVRENLPDPTARATFSRCALSFCERRRHSAIYALHRDLLRLRREDPVFSRTAETHVDGAVLGPATFVLRFFEKAGDDRLLLVNFGRDLRLSAAPEPLLAPAPEKQWELLWTSDAVCYGGLSTPSPETEEGWIVSGESAVVLRMADESPATA